MGRFTQSEHDGTVMGAEVAALMVEGFLIRCWLFGIMNVPRIMIPRIMRVHD